MSRKKRLLAYAATVVASLAGYAYHALYQEDRSVKSRLLEDFYWLKDRLKNADEADYRQFLEDQLKTARQGDLSYPKKHGMNISLSSYQNGKAYVLSPENYRPDKLVVYFHGGHRIEAISPKEWRFLENFAEDNQLRLLIPYIEPLSYAYFDEEVDRLEGLLDEINLDYTDEDLYLMASDTGALFALPIARDSSSNLILEGLILLSPWVTTKHSITSSQDEEQKDYLMTFSDYQAIASLWQASEGRIIALDANQAGALPKVHLFMGKKDVQYLEVLAFYRKLKARGLAVDFYAFDYLPHNFHFLAIPEQDEVIDLIAKVVLP